MAKRRPAREGGEHDNPQAGGRILVVDDDHVLRKVLRISLEIERHQVFDAANSAQALEIMENRPIDVAIVDVKLRGEDGLELMDRMLERDPQLPVIILTGNGSIENAIQAVRKGAYGYLTKPMDNDHLLEDVRKGIERRGLTREISMLNLSLKGDPNMPPFTLVGRCAPMQEVFRAIVQVAPTRATVVIYGESGTGKERVARAIHALSSRANEPFVAINCAALPDSLLESELFGHVVGAFTDARSNKKGLFREADGGTVFLDEISNTTPALQVSLLRVLQDKRVRPLGSELSIPIKTRIIVASNTDLRKEIGAGRFREDLFYRIHILPIYLPPLRERGEDILLLAEHFLRQHTREEGREVMGFHSSVGAHLRSYRWPGNVRELENRIKRAVVLATSPVIYPHDLFETARTKSLSPEDIDDQTAALDSDSLALPPFKVAKARFERKYLERLMASTHGNISAAARKAERYRADLYHLLRKHNLDPGAFK